MPLGTVHGRFCATALAAGAVVSLGSASVLCAQALHGTLQTTAHGSPVAGAIVVLEDTLRVVQARGRSDEQGRFVLRARSPGMFHLRIQRIGMRPYESAAFTLAGDTATVIALNELPFSLPQVTSRAASACGAQSFAANSTWQVWEDIRTALLATSLTYSDEQHRFSIAEVRRVYGANPATLRAVAVEEKMVTGTQPWTSFAPDVLAEHGYVMFAGDRLSFVSPDLDVLLSRSFENTHCFVPTLAHAGALVGLSFDPGRGLRNNTDVAGTFWLDSASHELRRLTFHHTGLPAMTGDSTGESIVRFATFDAHEWFIPEWTIRAPIPALGVGSRLPVLEQLRLFGDAVMGRDSRQFFWRLSGVNEQRGTVLAVHGADGARDTSAVWTAPSGAIRLAVTTRPAAGRGSVPVAGAEVELVGSTRQGPSDDAGAASFEGLTTGDYKVSVSTLEYTLFAEPPVVIDVHVDAGAATPAHVELKSQTELRMQRCRDTLQYVIVGSAVRDGAPVPGAHVSVYDPSFVDGVRVGTFNVSKVDGRFVVCTKRSGTPNAFELRATGPGDLEGAGVVRFAPRDHIQAIDLMLAPRKETKPPR